MIIGPYKYEVYRNILTDVCGQGTLCAWTEPVFETASHCCDI
jgi:hypothetical protein